jgi:hypothetical protein
MRLPLVPSNLATKIKPEDIRLEEYAPMCTFCFATLGNMDADHIAASLVRMSQARGEWSGYIYPEPPGRECSIVPEMVRDGLLSEKRLSNEAWLYSLTVKAVEMLAATQAERETVPPQPSRGAITWMDRVMYFFTWFRIPG